MFGIAIALLLSPSRDPMHSAGLQDELGGVPCDHGAEPQASCLTLDHQGACRRQEWWQWSFFHCSAYHALLASDRRYWSPWISRIKHTKSLGLDYLSQCWLSLWAGMREMGRMAPLLSSRGKEAGQRKPAGCTSPFLSVYSKEKWRRSLKLGHLHRFLGQSQAQQWY